MRISPAAPLAWARPRRELLLLALCAVAALSTVNLIDVQDQSRWCLTSSLVHGRLNVDGCIGVAVDRARYGGHLYSNKAPGMSILAVPAALAAGYTPTVELHQFVGWQIWLVRLIACGLPFLLAAFLVGRTCEGLARGSGGPALVTFALGTAVAPFAVAGFDHVPTAAFGFAAFVLAWRRRPLLAGLAAGAAVLCEYEAATIVGIVGLYALLLGRRSLGRYALGVLPGAALLGAYDWAAFGRPWRTPLPYSDNEYRAVHKSGLFGVHLPNLHSIYLVFAGPGGLLVLSPVLVLAATGLVLLWRRGLRAEAATCGLVTAVFLLAECGYGDPYGGYSPLPRYLIPALPFLAVGLAAAFERARALTSVLALASVLPTMAVSLTWTMHNVYPGGIWRSLGDVLTQTNFSWLLSHLTPNALTWLGVSRELSGLIPLCVALVALVFALGREERAPAAVPIPR